MIGIACVVCLLLKYIDFWDFTVIGVQVYKKAEAVHKYFCKKLTLFMNLSKKCIIPCIYDATWDFFCEDYHHNGKLQSKLPFISSIHNLE